MLHICFVDNVSSVAVRSRITYAYRLAFLNNPHFNFTSIFVLIHFVQEKDLSYHNNVSSVAVRSRITCA
jgi:hypothetical protein